MQHYTKQDIISMVEENDVKFIKLQFTDVFGALKNVAITVNQLENALNNMTVFDGSSIEGFVRIEESDMYLYPDLNTFTILPWRPQNGKVARMICDVYHPEGNPFEGDSRYILKQVLKKVFTSGYMLEVGPECEFFLFHTDDNGQPTVVTHEKAGYFDASPLDLGENARRDIILMLEDMGFEIESSHHEVSPAQHEIDFKYSGALATADNILTFKNVVKTVAKRHGLHASFLPKPIPQYDGSGMHINFSLKKGGKDVFFDPDKPMQLSDECLYFIGGLMKHAKALTCICNPLINSYKRLVPGYEAPVAIAWSTNNRSPLIRIPSSRMKGTRVEFRGPDATANPYLALAVCIAAGFDGIENKIMPPAPIGKNIYQLTDGQMKELGLEYLPATLGEACQALEEDELIKNVLGSHISEIYLDAKKREWREFCSHVSQWEIDRYLYKY